MNHSEILAKIQESNKRSIDDAWYSVELQRLAKRAVKKRVNFDNLTADQLYAWAKQLADGKP